MLLCKWRVFLRHGVRKSYATVKGVYTPKIHLLYASGSRCYSRYSGILLYTPVVLQYRFWHSFLHIGEFIVQILAFYCMHQQSYSRDSGILLYTPAMLY